jgi:hypothetical protein
MAVTGRAAAAWSARADIVRIARIEDGRGERGGGPGRAGHDEQRGRQARGRAQPHDPPAPAKVRAESLSHGSGSVSQPGGRWLEVAPYQAGHGKHMRQGRAPPARTRGWLPGGNLGPDPVEPVTGWLDRVGGQQQRAPQGALKNGLAWSGASVAHASRSSTVRSAASAREVWLFTAPLVIPIASAIWASDMSA